MNKPAVRPVPLNPAQIQAAKNLLGCRPVMFSMHSTCTLSDRVACLRWYNAVLDAMERLHVGPTQIPEFCDVAGVAD